MDSRTVEQLVVGKGATLRDLVLPAAVLAVVGMMMFPLPSALLDTLLICNITFSLALLLNSVYLSEPERFTALPTVLLLSTCLLYTSPSPRDGLLSRMPSSA